MIRSALKYLFAFVITLHCLGATQALSAYAKDKSAFIGMLNINEEETKKEKECKDEVDDMEHASFKPALVAVNVFFTGQCAYYADYKNEAFGQFVIESPTPPPDLV